MNDLEMFQAYLLERRKMPKINYHREALKEIEAIRKTGMKPRILLHACCVVCACWPLEFLSADFEITVLYNNSNIYPFAEYEHRLAELKRYIKERWHNTIEVIEFPYEGDSYMQELAFGKDQPEGWQRCFFCYEKRMRECFAWADAHGFDYFTTVMTFSRQKDSQKMNEIGRELQKSFSRTKYFFSDFKKDNGQLKSNQICEDYCLYKQNYCGCVYSLHTEKKDQPEQP